MDASISRYRAAHFAAGVRQLLFLFLVCSPACVASELRSDTSSTALIAEASSKNLDTDSTWLRLLHFDSDKSRSEILTPDFFLAEAGAHSPGAELIATIDAFFAPAPDDLNAHPRCRFPARYLWLSQHLDMPQPDDLTAQCPRLAEWSQVSKLQSISLIMVSGYFGNPASSFGHTLLKLNNSDNQSRTGLFDLSINYGALVPQNESPVTYIARGIWGGYQAGFSDKYYYTHDLVYSRTEFRDMWDYELNLDSYQTRLLAFHVWELVGRKFTYYFLKENCGYRMAELMELVTGRDFVSDVQLWYAPVATFHRLREVDAGGDSSIFRSVRFIPSSQRVLYANFNRLSAAEANIANAIIRDGIPSHERGLTTLERERRLLLLDAVLAYYQYRLAGDESEESRQIIEEKDALLRYRLNLPPVLEPDELAIEAMRPPSLGSRPSAWGIDTIYSDALGTHYRTRYTLFDYSAMGNNNLGGSELVIFDLAAGYLESGEVFLDYWDWVRARKINAAKTPIEGERRWSWEVAAGIHRRDNDCTRCQVAYASGGIGRAAPLSSRLAAYGLIGGTLDSSRSTVSFEPKVGLIIDGGNRWRSEFEIAYEYHPSRSQAQPVYRFESRYSLSQNHEIRIAASDANTADVSLSYVFHW